MTSWMRHTGYGRGLERAGRTWRFAALAALTSLCALAPASASADVAGTLDNIAKTQTATSEDGWWRMLEAGTLPDPTGEYYTVTIDFGFPKGATAGNGPQHAGEADLRKPWVSITGARNRARTVDGETAGGYGVVTICSNFTNPSSYRADVQPNEEHYMVDVRCDDGRGYDFYRLRQDYEVVRIDPWEPCEPVVEVEDGLKWPVPSNARGMVPEGAANAVSELQCPESNETGNKRHYEYYTWSQGWGGAPDYAKVPYYRGVLRGIAWYETSKERVYKAWRVTTSLCGHRGETVECFPKFYGGWSDILAPMEVDARLHSPHGFYGVH